MNTKDRRALKAQMALQGKTGKDLAKAIGISLNAFYNKMNGLSVFTIDEATLICEALRMDEAADRGRLFLGGK